MTAEDVAEDLTEGNVGESGRSREQIVGAVLAIGIGLIFILRGARWHPINSDDVAWQVALRTWRPGSETLVLPENSYVLKFPLFLVANAVAAASVSAVVLEVLLLNAVALFLVWHFARYAAAEAAPDHLVRSRWTVDLIAATAVAFTWASSEITWDLASRLTNRNLEIGLAAALLEVLHRLHVAGPENRFRAWWLVAGIAIGVVLVNDPLVAYSLVIPYLAVLGGLAILGRWRPSLAAPAAICTISIVVWRIAVAGGSLIGVDQVSLGAGLAEVRQVPRQLLIGLDALARTTGVTVFSADFGTEAFALGALRLILLVTCVVVVIVTWKRSRRSGAAIAAIAWSAALLGVFVLSTHGASLINIRYVAIVVAAVPAVIAAAMVRLHGRTLIVVWLVLLVPTAWSLVSAIGDVDGPAQSPNALRTEMAAALRDVAGDGSDDTVVFGDFWDAHVHSYFTDLEPQVLAVGCASGLTVPRYWISDFSRFTRPPAERSIFIYNPEPGLFTCPRSDLLAQFGEPDQVIPVGTKELWIFDGDLGLFTTE